MWQWRSAAVYNFSCVKIYTGPVAVNKLVNSGAVTDLIRIACLWSETCGCGECMC